MSHCYAICPLVPNTGQRVCRISRFALANVDNESLLALKLDAILEAFLMFRSHRVLTLSLLSTHWSSLFIVIPLVYITHVFAYGSLSVELQHNKYAPTSATTSVGNLKIWMDKSKN